MKILEYFKSNSNKKHLANLFDYTFYKHNLEEYSKLRQQIKIDSVSDVDFVLTLLQKLPYKEEYSYSFDPVVAVLKLFNRNGALPKKILLHYFDRILPILKLIFPYVPANIILETLYCTGTSESLDFFLEIVSDINSEVDDYSSYNAIKAFIDADQEVIDIFAKNADKLLQYNKFRTVAFVELFSQWKLEKKLQFNPTKDHLKIIEKWIESKNYESLSYAVSGCAALGTINTKPSIELLLKASSHPKLEVQLEATFSRILLGDEKAKLNLKRLVQNPIISNYALPYLRELTDIYKIDLGFTETEIMDEIVDKEDFIAMSTMSEWCMYPTEYGQFPDTIKVWAKKELNWYSSGEKIVVYLIKYEYKDFEWEGKKSDIEHVGYYIPSSNQAFSLMKNFDKVEEAYAEYAVYNIK